MKNIITLIAIFTLTLWPSSALAIPFLSCPSKAFLMQDTTAKLYGVNLVTGGYDLLSNNLGTSERINGVGFSFHDNYIYGWGYEFGTLVRIGRDYQSEPLSLTNNPGGNYYVGDVSVSENAYYFYRPGSAFGLYRTSLDPEDESYLVVEQVIDGGQLNLSIFDLAFHPDETNAYSVNNNGVLFRIDTATGTATNLGNVGESGTFGAVYFDVEGTFYISRNQDGHIFRIDPLAQTPQAEFFAYGPASGNNDGARCAIAPVVDDSEPATTDFGDAPETYGTTLSGNGARHGITSLYFGSTVDAEYDAQVYPLSDEEFGNDEDGIIFITPFNAGLDSLVEITVNGIGYVNIWADWDQNGQFDSDEQLMIDQFMSNQTETFLLTTPLDALAGNTWLRARVSSTQGLVASGGVADGEVEDYRILVINEGLSQIQHSPVYLAFEDNWPELGDYDLNDVVVKQESSVLVTETGEVVLLEINGSLRAMGAGYSNGFAIKLDGIEPTNIKSELIRFEINGVPRSGLIELGTDDMVLLISENLQDEVSILSGCTYYRTEQGCEQNVEMVFSLKVPLLTPVADNAFPQAPYNPFIFASPGTWHGASVGSLGRPLEIHLKNHLPTSKASQDIFGTADDASAQGLTYQTANGLPWALAIFPGSGAEWQHPLERTDLLEAYPDFEEFVNSNGDSAKNWYEAINAIQNKLY